MNFSSPTVSESLMDGLVEKIQVSHNSFDWYLFPYDTNKENDVTANLLEGSNRRYIKIAEFKITKEDAIAYRYSISTKNRVQKWNDLTVSVWI